METCQDYVKTIRNVLKTLQKSGVNYSIQKVIHSTHRVGHPLGIKNTCANSFISKHGDIRRLNQMRKMNGRATDDATDVNPSRTLAMFGNINLPDVNPLSNGIFHVKL